MPIRSEYGSDIILSETSDGDLLLPSQSYSVRTSVYTLLPDNEFSIFVQLDTPGFQLSADIYYYSNEVDPGDNWPNTTPIRVDYGVLVSSITYPTLGGVFTLPPGTKQIIIRYPA